MTSIFRSYPSHPWLSDWTLEPRGCGTAFREINGGHFFQTTETVGRIAPSTEVPEWSLQLPIPQNSRINMLFNGFCGYFDNKKEHYAAETLVPEPGVIWGRFSNIPAPVLLSAVPPDETEGFLWLESDKSPALFLIRDDTFCLITKSYIRADAVELAESYMAQDFESRLADELELRAGAITLFEQMNHHDALTVISIECLMRALRPAEGHIPGIWSQSPKADTPHFDTNDIYPLALAWRHIDIETAEQLILTTLKVQTSSGAIPVAYAPNETFSILEAPKPLMVKAAEEVWKIRNRPEFLEAIVQPLRRHLQWLLHHFDPKRRGLHCWQNSNEPLLPEIYESDLATVDLTVLLLTEIEALHRLQSASPLYAEQAPFFAKEHGNLEQNLQTQFWNDQENQFTNAIVRGKMAKVRGFPAFVPLLWPRLPITQQNQVIDPIRESGNLPGGLSLLSWRKSALDDQSFPLLQQLLVLEVLKIADPHGSLISGFSRLIMQGFIEWHSMSVGEYGTLRFDSVTAAFIINLQETRHGVHHARGRFASAAIKVARRTRTDWFDILVVAASILAIVMVHTVYNQLRKPPPFITLQAEMNSAYASKDAARALEAGNTIIRHYPEQSVMAFLVTGNMLLIQKHYEEAAVNLAEVRKVSPDSPGPMISLGLAYQLQGNFELAEKNYDEFIYLFGEIFPDLADILKKNCYLMDEGFRSPPKWREIYRYQLMHEL